MILGRVHCRGHERGLATTELAILMPFILILVLAVTFVGEVAQHNARTQAAADAAARSAAFAHPAQAQAMAQQVADANCKGAATAVKFDEQVATSFTPGWIGIEVTCTESFDSFLVLRNSSDRTATARSVAAREFWRPES